MTSDFTRLDLAVRWDRAVVLAGLAAVTVLAWTYLVYLASDMASMDVAQDLGMAQMHSWGAVELLVLFAMWAVMMVAMMLPSVTPLVLIFVRANRAAGGTRIVGSAGNLLLGYLIAWWGFSVPATLAQWGLHSAALLSPMMESTSSVFAGVLLVAAGIFQFTPLKRTCLLRCRSPLSFLMTEWRNGHWGTLVMGLKHGIYCVGCCWVLMALLFAAGVMNLLWVAVISVVVLVEKTTPWGKGCGGVLGSVLIVAGTVLVMS